LTNFGGQLCIWVSNEVSAEHQATNVTDNPITDPEMKWKMNYKRFSLLIGFTIWLLATVAFRVAGQYFFLTENPVVLTGLYLILIPVLGFVANWVFNKYGMTRAEAVQAAVMMVLPGMIFDAFCIKFFAWVFPNLPESQGATFGSWLMWAYALVLIFGLMRKGSRVRS